MTFEGNKPGGNTAAGKRGFLFPSICVFLLLGFIGLVIHFEAVKNKYKDQAKSVDSIHINKQRDINRMNGIKRRRAKTLAKAYLRSFPVLYTFAAANFLRRLSLTIPTHIHLVSLNLNGNLQSFNFSMAGYMAISSPLSELRDLSDRLRQLDNVSNVNLKYTQSQSPTTQKSRIEFIFVGEVELE